MTTKQIGTPDLSGLTDGEREIARWLIQGYGRIGRYEQVAITGDARKMTQYPRLKKFGPYRVTLIDPPWSYSFGHTNAHDPRMRGIARKHYETMTLTELADMPISNLAHKSSVVLLWCTWPHLAHGIELIKAWGHKYVTGFPWVKLVKSGALSFGVGHWIRGVSECILIGKRGPHVKLPSLDFAGILSQRLGHSRKPHDLQHFAQSLPGPYLEVFAREPRTGWVTFGNEIASEVLTLETQIARIKRSENHG